MSIFLFKSIQEKTMSDQSKDEPQGVSVEIDLTGLDPDNPKPIKVTPKDNNG